MSRSSKLLTRLFAAFMCCFLLAPILMEPAAAAMDFSAKGEITVEPQYGGKRVDDCEFDLYQVGSIKKTTYLTYELLADFAETGIDLNAADLADTALAAAKTLAQHASDKKLVATTSTKANGSNVFAGLELGVYLVVQTAAPGRYTKSAPFLVFVPVTEKGQWDYSVSAFPKLGYDSPGGSDSKSIRVTKVWKDTGYEADRPESIEVGLYDGERLHKTVELNNENDWEYLWKNLSTSKDWSVKEIDVPAGYESSISHKGNTYTITNSKTAVPVSDSFKVSKVWINDNDEVRPGEVEVTLYRDGVAYETVKLTAANSWSYSWRNLGSGSTWTVQETSSHEGYTASVEVSADGDYIIKNTYEKTIIEIPEESTPIGPGESPIPIEPDPDGNTPQTGMVQWPVPVLLTLGMLLIAAGLRLETKKKYE